MSSIGASRAPPKLRPGASIKGSSKSQEGGYRVNCCSLCKARESNERPVLHSSFCGHRVCVSCLKKEKMLVDRGTELVSLGIVDQGGAKRQVVDDLAISCSLCDKSFPRSSWVNLIHEQQAFNRYQKYRERVLSVMNSNRDRFVNTPAYDDYIEKREERINAIAEATEENRRELLEELRQEEKKMQVQILEDNGKTEEKRREEVIGIVEKEGIFFEMCANPLDMGFQANRDRQLMHPLVNKHPEYFEELHLSGAAKGGGGGGVIGGFAMPMPLDTSISSYPQSITKTPFDPKRASDLYKACGFRKETQALKMRLELRGSYHFRDFRKYMKSKSSV